MRVIVCPTASHFVGPVLGVADTLPECCHDGGELCPFSYPAHRGGGGKTEAVGDILREHAGGPEWTAADRCSQHAHSV